MRSEQAIGLLFDKGYSKCTPNAPCWRIPPTTILYIGGRRVGESPQLPYCTSGGAVLANPPNYHTAKVRLWGKNYIKVRFLERTFFIPVLWV